MMFGVATTMPADSAPTATKNVPEVPVPVSDIEDDADVAYPVLSSPFEYLLLGLIVLVLPAGIFVWCGGVSWVRRVFAERTGKAKGKYAKVKSDDLEK